MTLDARHPAATRPDSPAPTSSADAPALDVRTLPHGARHDVIFDSLDALEPGQTFVILNDHDPKPLRYQTEALWPGVFGWVYLESGQDLWRVAITRAA